MRRARSRLCSSRFCSCRSSAVSSFMATSLIPQRLIEALQGIRGEQIDFRIVEYIGRHQVNGVADRAQQYFILQAEGEQLAWKLPLGGGIDHGIESPDHAALAEMPDAWMFGQRC